MKARYVIMLSFARNRDLYFVFGLRAALYPAVKKLRGWEVFAFVGQKCLLLLNVFKARTYSVNITDIKVVSYRKGGGGGGGGGEEGGEVTVITWNVRMGVRVYIYI